MNKETEVTQKKVIYIDMDNTLVDFMSGVHMFPYTVMSDYEGKMDEIPGVFAQMKPMPGAIKAFNALADDPDFEVYLLSTAPWENPSAWSDKLNWVKRYLGENAYKRLILTHNKQLNRGWMLIDDRRTNGAGEFEGHLIQFGKDTINWESTVERVYAIHQQEHMAVAHPLPSAKETV